MSRRSFAVAALCAALSGVLWLELDRAGMPLAEPAQPKSSAETTAAQSAPFGLPPLAQYSELVERTLFDSSRRAAPEEPDEVASASAAELRELVLTGVVVTPELKIAFLRDKAPNQVIRVEPGGAVGKWLLTEVRENGVTLRRGATTRELLLYDADEALPAKTAVQDAPPPLPEPVVSQPPPAVVTRAQDTSSPASAPPTRAQRRMQRSRAAIQGGAATPAAEEN
jgi:general secretion pathway protein N